MDIVRYKVHRCTAVTHLAMCDAIKILEDMLHLERAMARMEWNGMEWNGMEWNGMEWNGMEWNGMEWNGMEWNGMEWNGMEWNGWNGIQ
ncbi:hypothetical protein QZH41_006008 [Actinostola sp. cb2023]|nr:hypothetical protein QZH41_006008 [Actinostola sp. cb2023]